MCYNLIMWDSIQPDIPFIDQSVPSVVEGYLRTRCRFSDDPENSFRLIEEDDLEDVVDFESLAQVLTFWPEQIALDLLLCCSWNIFGYGNSVQKCSSEYERNRLSNFGFWPFLFQFSHFSVVLYSSVFAHEYAAMRTNSSGCSRSQCRQSDDELSADQSWNCLLSLFFQLSIPADGEYGRFGSYSSCQSLESARAGDNLDEKSEETSRTSRFSRSLRHAIFGQRTIWIQRRSSFQRAFDYLILSPSLSRNQR